MATITQRDSGWWQARVRRKGFPIRSKTFRKKSDAEAWARAEENEMDRGVFISRTESEQTTFASAADRYRREILPSKRGGDRDAYRLNALVAEFGAYALAAINSAMVADWRDRRLSVLSPQSVVHEINLLSRVLRAATIDWGIALPNGIPTAMVRKPTISNERTRRLVGDEEARILAAIDDPGSEARQRRNSWMRPIFVLAIETAARQSELLSLVWRDVDLNRRVARIRGAGGGITKNDDQFRDVPLSSRAIEVLANLPRSIRGPVFPTTGSAIKQSWERAVTRARKQYEREELAAGLEATGLTDSEIVSEIRKVTPGRKPAKPIAPHPETVRILEALAHDPLLVDLHFHDLRHEATSRLADKLQLHELMKVTGHKGTRMLARYYHPRAEDLARKLG